MFALPNLMLGGFEQELKTYFAQFWAWGLVAPLIVALDRRLPFSGRQLGMRVTAHLAASPVITLIGFYIIRDSNYGYTVGALAGGVVGILMWAGGGVSKDVLQGLAWGTVIGAGAGIILGVIEGSIRVSNGKRATASNGLRLGLGFTPSSEGVPLPYPNLSARF